MILELLPEPTLTEQMPRLSLDLCVLVLQVLLDVELLVADSADVAAVLDFALGELPLLLPALRAVGQGAERAVLHFLDVLELTLAADAVRR